MDILDNLYYGNLSPFDFYKKKSTAYIKRQNKISNARQKLYKKLKQDELKILTQMEEWELEQKIEDNCQSFKNGFSLCLKIIEESNQNFETLISNINK